MNNHQAPNHKDAVLAMVLLFLLVQLKWHLHYGILFIAAFIILALLSNAFAGMCNKAWLFLTKILSHLSNFILLSLVYAIVVLPTAVYIKLFKKSGIKFKSVNPQSNFIITDKQFCSKDFIHPW